MARWGYSQLSTYVYCPLMFYWQRIAPIPGIKRDPKRFYIGSLLGELVNRVFAEQWWRAPAHVEGHMRAMIPVIGSYITTHDQIVWAPGEERSWWAIADAAVPRILQVIRDEQLVAPQIAIEYDICVPLTTDRVFGRIDYAISRADGSLILLDGKGGATIGKWVKTDQLRLYALGVLADPRFQRLPDKVGFWWFRHGTIVWKKLTLKTLAKFVEGVRTTIARIKAADWTPKPGSHCRTCDFLLHCEVGRAAVWHENAVTGLPMSTNSGTLDLHVLDRPPVE